MRKDYALHAGVQAGQKALESCPGMPWPASQLVMQGPITFSSTCEGAILRSCIGQLGQSFNVLYGEQSHP